MGFPALQLARSELRAGPIRDMRLVRYRLRQGTFRPRLEDAETGTTGISLQVLSGPSWAKTSWSLQGPGNRCAA